MEHIDTQTRYHLIEVNLFYILVYAYMIFFFVFMKDFQVNQGKKLPQIKLSAKKPVFLLNAPL